MARSSSILDRATLAASLLLALDACSSVAADDSSAAAATAQRQERLAMFTNSCESSTAGGGWVNTPMPDSSASFVLQFDGFPSTAATPPTIDAVIGLSRGPAHAFTDLGPTVRFNPNGNIDARNGDHYEGAFPYRTGDGPFEVRMDVDVPSHSYTAWARHLDSPNKPFELLGQGLAFRSELSAVGELDNVGRFVDSPEGHIETCNLGYTATNASTFCSTSRAGDWASQAFPPHGGSVHLELDATADAAAIDAVVGASFGAPSAFTDLAVAARFNPNGTFDARNGASYGADTELAYAAGTPYHIAFDLDFPSHSYAVAINARGQAPTTIAHGYAFRSEQSAVAAIDHTGEFVDGASGSLQVCFVNIRY